MTPTPDASVLIVAWNGRDILLRCLEALHREPQGVAFETLVIDNASSDGTPDAVARAFPQVRLERNAFNRGFARAVNQGLRLARGRVPVLLNPDTLPGPGLLGRLVRYLDATPDAGIAGVQLLHEDGTRQNSIDNDPRLVTEVVPKGVLRRLFPRRFPSKRVDFSGPTGVETVIGACLAVRREAIEQAGMLDEGYFLFLEETDWCGAMRRAGWRVVHVPDARLVHLQGKSKDVAPAEARIEYLRSLFRWFRKNRGGAAWIALRTVRLVRSAIDLVGASAGCLATGFADSRRRTRLGVVARTLGWQLRGCPETDGLQSQAWLDERPALAAPPLDALPPPALAPADLADLDALARRPGVETLKDVRIKRLFRIRTGDAAWLVKVYRAREGARRLPAAWAGTRAEHEAAVAREAALRGVPTVVPDLVVVRRVDGRPAESAVVVRERTEAVPLDRFLRAETSRARRVAAVEAYARLARRMHDTGVHQDDFDPNNALVEWEEGRPRLWLIDHERVSIRTPLAPDERAWNLAKLHRFEAATVAERARFLRAYVGRGLPDGGSWRDLAGRVSEAHRRVRVRDFARAVRAAEKTDRNIGVQEAAGTRALYRRRWPAADARATAGPPGDGRGASASNGAWLAAIPALPRPARTGLRAEALVGVAGEDHACVAWLEPSPERARAIWASAQGLLRVRAPVVPLVLARFGAGAGTLLVAADARGSRELAGALATAGTGERAALSEALGRALGAMSAAGVGFPFVTATPPVFPDLRLLRVGPSGTVRFVPGMIAEPLARAAAGEAEAVETVRAWATEVERVGGPDPEIRRALARGFAFAAGLPARARAGFERAVAR